MDWKTLSLREIEELVKLYPALSKEEQERLAAVAATGDEQARELLFKHNAERLLYFVTKFAPEGPGWRGPPPANREIRALLRWKNYAPKEITADEILAAAQEGLWRAICTFDPLKGSFNQHANVQIWRAIQALREKAERHSFEEPEPQFPPIGAREEDRFNREMAWMLLEVYAEKALGEEAGRFLAMVEGREEPDYEFLRSCGERLREQVPEADWCFMKEHLFPA